MRNKSTNHLDITKLKRGQEERAKAAEMMEAMDGVCVIDIDAKIIDVNSAFEKITGYTRDELIGEVPLKLHTEREREAVLAGIRECMERGFVRDFETVFLRRDKEEIPILLNGTLAKDAEGKPKWMIATFRDITERKRAEEALRETEARLRVLVERTSDWVWEVNLDGVYTYASPKVKDLLGYEPEEVIGRTPFDLMPPEEAKRIAEEFRAIVESQRPFARLENPNRHKDGRLVVLETSGVPFFDADGRLCGYRGIDRDITERKRLEHELEERVKELDCLYSIARIAEKPDITLDELYQEVADLLPESWRYPEIACARIIIDNKRFETENYRETEWKQSSDIKVRQARAGVVEVCYLEERPEIDEGLFSKEERLLIDAIAERLGRITERKQAEEAQVAYAAAVARAEELQRSRQRIVTVQESLRRDIAQQLHGSVQNRLIVLLHRLTELERASSPGELAAELGDLRQKLAELLESDIRLISHRLYPAILRRGLVPALQSLVDQFEATVAIEMELDEDLMRQERADRKLLLEQVRLAAYHIAEEALTNVVKYAKASRVTVGLELSSEGWLRLTVRDNGQGFDVGSASAGLGIPMTQDYAGVVGGQCVIRSAPGEGTEVAATLPLAGPAAEHPQRASPLA